MARLKCFDCGADLGHSGLSQEEADRRAELVKIRCMECAGLVRIQ